MHYMDRTSFERAKRSYTKEQQMRNTIRVIDKDVPKVTIGSLAQGQMYRYPKNGNDQNIYMKLNGFQTVLLSTGVTYNPNPDAEVEVIDAINISR